MIDDAERDRLRRRYLHHDVARSAVLLEFDNDQPAGAIQCKQVYKLAVVSGRPADQ